jgi:peptide alpha-N-acetyltransferase
VHVVRAPFPPSTSPFFKIFFSLTRWFLLRYELASGESYFRQGDLGRALKNFLSVEKHYTDMTEDQFDFHSYCLRKMTLRAYVSMLKFQDRLHAHEYFHKAAAGAIR